MARIVNITSAVIERMPNSKLVVKQQKLVYIKRSSTQNMVMNLAFTINTLQLDSIKILKIKQYARKSMAKIVLIIFACRKRAACKTYSL